MRRTNLTAMFERIVVVLEGVETAQLALERAALCATHDTLITVLDVVHEPLLDGYLGNRAVYESLRGRVVAERQERADELAAALERRGIKAVGKAVWEPQRETAVNALATAESADLVVAAPLEGAHGLSSSDWRLVATCPAPVLMVKTPPDKQYRRIVAAVDPFHARAKPADLDAKILATAAKLRAATRSSLTALHCFTPPEYFRADVRLADRDDQIESMRRQTLETLLRDTGMSDCEARVLPGAPHNLLRSLAERREADVIVMGALARGRLKDWIIGSTAERVLSRVAVDVLTVNVPPAG